MNKPITSLLVAALAAVFAGCSPSTDETTTTPLTLEPKRVEIDGNTFYTFPYQGVIYSKEEVDQLIDDVEKKITSNVYGGDTPPTGFSTIKDIVEALPSYVKTNHHGNVSIEGSVAFGTNAVATGIYSFAHGTNVVASGPLSHAEGDCTQATGEVSHAEGIETRAYGDYSHAEGDCTQAIGYGSHAEGAGSIASNDISHAEGVYTIAKQHGSHAEGVHTEATGWASHAEGDGSIAEGHSSHAECGGHAVGWNSHAEGGTANGMGAHAEASTRANGNNDHSEGLFTRTGRFHNMKIIQDDLLKDGVLLTSKACHSEGYETVAEGFASHVAGIYTRATNHTSFVWQGKLVGDVSYDLKQKYYPGDGNVYTNEIGTVFGSFHMNHIGNDSNVCLWGSDTPDDAFEYWPGVVYTSHGDGTFNINPEGGAEGFWIGEETLKALIERIVDERLNANQAQ